MKTDWKAQWEAVHASRGTAGVSWYQADPRLSPGLIRAVAIGTFDVWHHRAVFHFLTDVADRSKYVEMVRKSVPAGGHLVIASFADDGPMHCSDLDVCRYNARTLAGERGEAFSLIRDARETHTTPWNSSQAFFYGVFRRR
jgi:hypothetical protein